MAHYIRLFVVLLAIIFGEKSIAQNKTKADSLKTLLATCEIDSERINLLLQLAKFDMPMDERLAYAEQALSYAKKNKYKNKQGLSLEYISLCNRKLGNLPEAIKASLEALRIYDELGFENKTAALQLQIGSHFTSDKNFTEASRYMNLALTTFRNRKDTVNVAYTLINLGETYRLMEEYDSSSKCFNECLRLNRYLKRELVQGYALGNLGMVHSRQQIVSAKQELSESIKILNKLGDYYSVSVYQCELGKILIDEGQSKAGERLILLSLEIAEKESLKEQIRDISNDLSIFYEEQHKFEKALFYRKKYEIYNDSLVNIDNVRKVEQLHNQYWLDKKEVDIQLLETKNENKQKLVIILSVGAFLLLTLSIFLFRIQRQRKKAFKKVSEQNVIIEKREQEKALLLRELNHRVKNNLQMVASLFNLQANQFKGHEVANALKAARNRVDTLILIHQKLYRPDIDALVSLDDYIKELTDYLVFSSGKKVDLTLNLIPFKLSIDSAIPLGLIINELITNSLKYAGEDQQNPALNISLSENGESVILTLTDNGTGLPEDFDVKERQSLGIKLVYSLIKQLNGEISHSNNNGCQWLIALNKNKL